MHRVADAAWRSVPRTWSITCCPMCIRQWVLSLPYRLRYQLAWDHDLCRAVVGVALRVALGFLYRQARHAGVRGGRSGAVTIIQRFGGALNLNVHIHALVMDGVFAADGAVLRFYAAPRLTRADVAAVVAEVARRIERLLQRRGLTATPDEGGVTDPWAEEAPSLAGLAAASVQGLLALGPQAGARVARFGSPPEAVVPTPVGPCHAQTAGFDLHAGVVVRAGERARLERVCRYALPPPLAQARLRLDAAGHVWIRLRHAWSDGTTERALALARSDHIGVDDLPPELGAAPATVQTADEIRTLAEVERDYIAAALRALGVIAPKPRKNLALARPRCTGNSSRNRNERSMWCERTLRLSMSKNVIAGLKR